MLNKIARAFNQMYNQIYKKPYDWIQNSSYLHSNPMLAYTCSFHVRLKMFYEMPKGI